MKTALRLILAKTDLQMIEGAGHDLMKGAFDIQERIVSPFMQLITPS